MPGGFNGGLKRKHKDFFEPHRLAQFITRKSLSESHFSVPQKLRRARGVVKLCLLEIRFRHFNGLLLFAPHCKIPGAAALEPRFRADFLNRYERVLDRATEPFVFVCAGVKLQKAFMLQQTVNVLIGKARSVRAHCRLFEQNLEIDCRRMQLFANARFRFLSVGVADFYVPVMVL